MALSLTKTATTETSSLRSIENTEDRIDEIVTYINNNFPLNIPAPTVSEAQYNVLALNSGKTGFDWIDVLRSDVPLSHDDGNGSAGEVLQSDGDGTTSWLAFAALTDGDKGDITVASSGASWTIDNDAVTTVKILDANVTTAKIADTNVTTAKIANSNVTTAKIADANVTTAKIADGAVDQDKLQFSWITKTNADSPYSASAGDFIRVDTSSGAVTITLPLSPSAGDKVAVIDYASNFHNNNCILGRNSENIESDASDLTINLKNFIGVYEYIDATAGWKRI